jgi:NAD(P)-dependent dehydrogenase (short-subunit alcohol dehydrogenase family)
MTQSIPEEMQKLAVERTPLGRMGSVSDVASLVQFLASAEASFITGTVIPVDGGQMLGHVA